MKKGNAKVFIAIMVLFCGATVAQQVVTEIMNRQSFSQVMSGFEKSLDSMRQETAENLEEMNIENARDLMEEIQIGIGESLQPGESQKFLYLAEKQAKLRGLREFSFYGPDQKIELSSSQDAVGRVIATDVWDEGARTKQLVTRVAEDRLQLFEPMFADADMVRLRPEMKRGQFYGMLFVELSRERVQSVIARERQIISQAMNEAQLSYNLAKRRSGIFSIAVVIICALLVTAVLNQVIKRWMQRPIQLAVNSLLKSTTQLDQSGRQVLEASGAVAQGTSSQAASLEETAAALEQMAAQTQQTAQDSERVDQLSSTAHTASQSSFESVGKMSVAISGIKDAADQSAVVINTINGIAFQTNLLALNAAVEAARAGDAGKGFAVVAEEVRNLAQRSAEAARNTAELIQQSVTRTEQGVQICGEVEIQLNEVVESVDEVNQLISSVAVATEQQASSIAEVNRAVNQMDQLTQDNAARAEETASASSEMNLQSRQVEFIAQELLVLAGGGLSSTEKTPSPAPAPLRKHKTPNSPLPKPTKVKDTPEEVVGLEAEDLMEI